MISFDNISITFDNKTIVKNFSLEISKNEKFVLWGKSGSGKSSLMSLLLGFHQPAAGSVSLNGTEINKQTIDTIREEIAWVPQEAALPFEYVKDVIAAPFQFKANKNKFPKKELILSYFEQLGLDASLYEKRLNEVSGGEQQRIMIAIAALLQKPVLLLDEPTSALDPDSIESLIKFIKGLEQTTMLAISHDRRFTESFTNLELKPTEI
ncbi:ATP-binding cassette domain-containing protein [Paludibacter sp. 221]|uniref:ABC transporter ATP-binding protein n=1 Tax=Paludibacter sp. 221 TaxID=2302939 RepID=UPI0013D29912|nr:ATP-binding cassette domain-containing protein [Paludibacter sp. 221]NDV45856.1 ATP-binding cassette domain-containing protein [Paludibacter sp. 221]